VTLKRPSAARVRHRSFCNLGSRLAAEDAVISLSSGACASSATPSLTANCQLLTLSLRETRKDAHEQVRLDRLGDVLLEAGVERALRVFETGVGSERHRGRARAVGAQLSDE
jgi:hypothetical protein